jgi:hypothetical protein
MPETSSLTSQPELKGTAGYESPYPYMDKLQEKMEERLAHRVPAAGRFCGFCYARIRSEETRCPFCESSTSARPAVNEIPQDVLLAYKAKASTEARWVFLRPHNCVRSSTLWPGNTGFWTSMASG